MRLSHNPSTSRLDTAHVNANSVRFPKTPSTEKRSPKERFSFVCATQFTPKSCARISISWAFALESHGIKHNIIDVNHQKLQRKSKMFSNPQQNDIERLAVDINQVLKYAIQDTISFKRDLNSALSSPFPAPPTNETAQTDLSDQDTNSETILRRFRRMNLSSN